MNETQFCINWNSYNNHVSKGFSLLQQKAEFVDMTLAAEGHLVKVHQNIVALASPYLKAMLQSTSCQHPVIFLNNVSHVTLGYILEYIYTGEVKIPTNIVDVFLAACKSLCINGINTIDTPKIVPVQKSEPIQRIDKPPDNFAAHITINTNSNDYDLELLPNRKVAHILNNHDETILASSLPIKNDDMEIENGDKQKVDDTVSQDEVDNNSINDLMIIKPKHVPPTKMDITTNKTDNAIQILSDITINPEHSTSAIIDWQTEHNSIPDQKVKTAENPVNITLNTSLIDNPVNITLDTDWFSNTNQNSLNGNITENILNSETCLPIPVHTASNMELNTNPINITLSTEDWHFKPSQGTSNIELNGKPLEESVILPLQTNSCSGDIALDKKRVYKNLKMIGSHMKLTRNQEKNLAKITQNKIPKITIDNSPHYTISNRGALQLIMNHYLYYSHHYSSGGRKKRWRCINYRRSHCPAYIDTDDENIIAMSVDHDHPNHDNQIRKKMKSNVIFTSLSNAIETIKNLLNDKNSNVDINKLDI